MLNEAYASKSKDTKNISARFSFFFQQFALKLALNILF